MIIDDQDLHKSFRRFDYAPTFAIGIYLEELAEWFEMTSPIHDASGIHQRD